MPPDYIAHSFVVKIWVEEPATGTGGATWRGYITHVPSGQRGYFQKPQDLADFIAPYLSEMGVKLGPAWRLRAWLRRHQQRFQS